MKGAKRLVYNSDSSNTPFLTDLMSEKATLSGACYILLGVRQER